MRSKWMTLISLLIVMINAFLQPGIAKAAPVNPLGTAALATVHVIIIDEAGDGVSSGSGSLVTSDGLILTNYHVINDNPRDDGNLVVRIPTSTRGSDYQLYTGRTVVVDEAADLAVVQLLTDRAGEALTHAQFPTLPLGDSDELGVGDEIYALGYPDIGSEHLVVTRGMVAGFLDDDSAPWVLSDVLISHGNSGGAIVNEQGELVAIPTEIRVGEHSAATMAYLRPINQARTLIARALGQGGRNQRSRQPASDVTTFVGEEILEIERMTLDGKNAPALENWVSNLFVNAVWTLQPEGDFQFEAVNGDEPMVWQGHWAYNEEKAQAVLETEIFEATLFTDEDSWYLYIALDVRTQEGERIRAEFYQALRFQEGAAAAPAGQTITVTIKNALLTDICYVYISSSTDDSWGDDWLGSEEVIEPRQQRQFELPPGTYDLLLKDCDGEQLAQLLEIELTENTTLTIRK